MTAIADNIAAKVRRWYEENRETWWDRVGVDEGQRAQADAFMLSLIAEVHRATAALTPGPLKQDEPVSGAKIMLPRPPYPDLSVLPIKPRRGAHKKS